MSPVEPRIAFAAPLLLAALRVLVREGESSLDYRPTFRAALSTAHSAIAVADGLDLFAEAGADES